MRQNVDQEVVAVPSRAGTGARATGASRAPVLRGVTRAPGVGARGLALPGRSVGAALTLLTLAALPIIGCAPQRLGVPDLAEAPRRVRFERALAARSARVSAEADLSAWVSGSALPELPGVQARLVLAAPDAFRMRVASLFGTALDVAAHGDSLTAYLPPKRLALETASSRESLGVGDPGSLGYRLWTATWRPTAAAWSAATWEDSLMVLRWLDDGDSVRLAIGAHGLPRWVEGGRGDRIIVRADYVAWGVFDGVAWPAQMVVEDAPGAYGLRCKIQNVHFRGALDRSRLAVAIPADAERVTRHDLMRAIRKLGTP